MKQFKISFLLIFVSAGVFAQSGSIDSSYNNSHYRQRLEFFKQMPDQKREIVFVGNSITEAGEWQELIPGKPVLNRGISGDVTFGVLARLDEILSSKPSKIFILIGINDLKRGIPAEVITANFEKIINHVKQESHKTKLIIQSVLPVNESLMPSAYQKITNLKVKELNQLLKETAGRHKVVFVDLHPVFEDENGQLKRELTTDGIHLKSSAYIHWTKYLKQKRLL